MDAPVALLKITSQQSQRMIGTTPRHINESIPTSYFDSASLTVYSLSAHRSHVLPRLTSQLLKITAYHESQSKMAQHCPMLVNMLDVTLHLDSTLGVDRVFDRRNNLSGEFLFSMVVFANSFHPCVCSGPSRA